MRSCHHILAVADVEKPSDSPVVNLSLRKATMMRVLLASALLFVASDAQMIRQCTCDELKPCHADADTFFKCGNPCRHHVTAVGLPYDALHQCFEDMREQIGGGVECLVGIYRNACANDGAPHMVPKRYIETFKLAFLSRIKSMLSRTGVLNDIIALFKQTKKFWSCKMKCVAKTAASDSVGPDTFERVIMVTLAWCGTLDPPDNELVEMYLNCAIQNGMNTEGFRRLCHCALNAGVRRLESVCDRLVIE
ncbi:hypothetical protein Q1695_004632 [Nippostrongylus brasiliensis]|nr:hypothetical protein Q1695_004632 [Nippostrongylus brasiliensis]